MLTVVFGCICRRLETIAHACPHQNAEAIVLLRLTFETIFFEEYARPAGWLARATMQQYGWCVQGLSAGSALVRTQQCLTYEDRKLSPNFT